MSVDVKQYDIPEGFTHWQGDPAEDAVGPFFFKFEDGVLKSAFRVEERHCNSHQTMHGGLLMMFADYTHCIAANGGKQESVTTVTCSNEFVSPGLPGHLLIGTGEVIRKGGSLVFVRVTIRDGDQVVLTSSAVVKRLSKR
ncbi:MAG: PaaI family thioesterase [Pseudohongiellaceae bacterium]|nr:PaaI family thioesterase [Pseudohongiellaceae bacterium]